MTTIYVSGPAVDEPDLPRVYRALRELAEVRGWEVRLPLRERDLDRMSPESFVDEIAGRIERCDGVVAVLVPRDWSGPCESTMAARSHKPQVILTLPDERVPRLLAGQPGVIGVMGYDEAERALGLLGEQMGELA